MIGFDSIIRCDYTIYNPIIIVIRIDDNLVLG